jgi:hypothetical protein
MILSRYADAAFSNATDASIHVAPLRGNGISQTETYEPPLYLQVEHHEPSVAIETRPVEVPATRRSLNTEDRHVFDIWAMRVAVFYFLVALTCLVTGWLRSDASVNHGAPLIIEFPPVQGLER